MSISMVVGVRALLLAVLLLISSCTLELKFQKVAVLLLSLTRARLLGSLPDKMRVGSNAAFAKLLGQPIPDTWRSGQHYHNVDIINFSAGEAVVVSRSNGTKNFGVVDKLNAVSSADNSAPILNSSLPTPNIVRMYLHRMVLLTSRFLTETGRTGPNIIAMLQLRCNSRLHCSYSPLHPPCCLT